MACAKKNALFAIVALAPLAAAPALAGPNGASVVAGAAAVQGQGTANVVVNQTSQNAIINWQTFNIGAGETTQILMPNPSSTELDRVTGGQGPSQIFGSITSNGQVFLVNADGILFGPNSKINAGSFLATTSDITNSHFMAGRYNFNVLGNPAASIVNQGTITAQTAGFAALVAPGVRNTGTITAWLGQVGLASANTFALDFYGDRLIQLNVKDSIQTQVIDVSTGQPLKALVENEGTLKANGGKVELTAVAARTVVDSVINNTGTIEADSVGTKNGMIVLEAATAADKPVGAPLQIVNVAGVLSAAGKKKGTTGGTIVVTGESVKIAGATINASGQSGGGAVLIGGAPGGGHPSPTAAALVQAEFQALTLPNASTVSVDAASTINASATGQGNGGLVVVWSNAATTFYGTILAQGGAQAGNGGFVETSGGTLAFAGTVNTSAPAGKTGTWLLDPTDLTVDAAAASTIDANLVNTNVVLQTNADGTTSGPGTTSSGAGDIIVASPLSWTSGNTLTLDAYNNIAINASITAASGGLTLNAGNGISAIAAVDVGTFNLQGGAWTQIAATLPAFSANDFTISGGSFLRALGGDGSTGSPYQITDVYGLQGIGSSSTLLADDYVLANAVDASGTANWNGGAGFVPIGNSTTPFTGTFNGQGNTINDLAIDLPSSSYVGLFGDVGTSGLIQNLGLVGGSVTGQLYVGGLAGYSDGTIMSSYATGAVNGSGTYTVNSCVSNQAGCVGGLVGINFGTITSSYATGTASGPITVGGLVGNDYGTVSLSYATGAVSATHNAGGLVGSLGNTDGGTITQSYATGAVTGTSNVGGLVGIAGATAGGSGAVVVSESYATGAVNGTSSVGGLVGFLGTGTPGNVGNASVTQSYATGSVAGTTYVGGLVGFAGNGPGVASAGNHQSVAQSYASGAVTGTTDVGGLVGFNNSTSSVSSSYWDTTTTGQASGYGANIGTFSATGLTTSQFATASNFSGFNFGTTPNASGCAAGTAACWVIVDADGSLNNAGGAAGATRPVLLSEYSTTITNPHQLQLIALDPTATYTLANNIDLGPALANASDVWGPNGSAGFVPIGNATTPFTGTFNGNNYAIIDLAIDLQSSNNVGLFGVVGSTGTVENALLLGATVTGGNSVGALAGLNDGTVTTSYSSSSPIVSGSSDVGGLVGANNGTVSEAFTFGTTSGASNIGGLIGLNTATVSNSSSSSVAFASSVGVGGLIGFNNGGTVTDTYATGTVSGSTSAGGLIGINNGTVTSSYWDTTTSGRSVGVGSGSAVGIAGLTTQDFGIASNFSGWNFGSTPSGPACASGGACWVIVDNDGTLNNANDAAGATRPILLSQYSTTINTTLQLQLMELDPAANYTLAANINSNTSNPLGQWAPNGSAGFVPIGNATTPFTGTFNGNGYTISGLAIAPTNTNISNIGVFGVIGAGGAVSNLTLANASIAADPNTGQFQFIGALAGQNTGAIDNVTVASGTINGLPGGVNVAGVTAGGLVGQNGIFGQSGGTITGSQAAANVTLGAGFACNSNSCSGPQNAAGGLVGSNAGTITLSSASGAIVVGSDATAGGLVGVNGGSVTNSSATGTVTGTTYTIVGGLVGTNFAGAIDSQLAQIIGVPGLDGVSLNGTISQSYATGTVSGPSGGGIAPDGSGTLALGLGGLVGFNNGTINQSYATGAVTEAVSVNSSLDDASGIGVALGGLVGINAGAISQSYAEGDVTGSVANPNSTVTGYKSILFTMGGLVGINVSGTYTDALLQALGAEALIGVNVNGTINQSYATGNVTGTIGNVDRNSAGTSSGGSIAIVAGGLVGINAGPISNFSYATGTVTGSVANASSVATDYVGILLSLGGLAGINLAGTISQAEAQALDIPSLSGTSLNGTISQSDATGNVIGSVGNVVDGDNSWIIGLLEGGLVAVNLGQISQSYATGDITSTVGSVDASSDPTASGGVDIIAGGLIGINAGPIANSHATGTVSGSVANPGSIASDSDAIGLSLGGLVGVDVAGTLTQAEANLINEPSLSGISVSGTIDNSYATGNVTGTVGSLSADNAAGFVLMEGGLVGINLGSISQSYADGNVTGTAGSLDATGYGGTVLGLGGLVGLNAATISQSYAIGSVTGIATSPNSGTDTIGLSVGGLVGINLGLAVSSLGQDIADIAQFFGIDPSLSGNLSSLSINGAVSQSYATGTVTGTVNNVAAIPADSSVTVWLGGLVGLNTGSIAESYASGAVSGSVIGSGAAGADLSVGGLVGINFAGPISTSEATSLGIQTLLNVTNATGVTLADLSWVDFEGTISQSYATGAVNGGTASTSAGGLVGYNNGSVSSSYWDETATGQTSGFGTNSGSFSATGLTTSQFQSGLPSAFDPTVWGTNSGVNNGYPYLLWQSPTLPVAVTYSVADATSTYGTLATLGTATLTGIAAGATVTATVEAFLNGVPVTVAANTPAGTYTEEVVALSNPSYVIASSGNTPGTLIIAPATLTIATAGTIANRVYNGTTTATAATNGTLGGTIYGSDASNLTLTLSDTTFASANAGAEPATGIYVLGGSAAGNYTLGSAANFSGSATITPASIIVTALGGNSTYGSSPTNPGLSATGLQNGQSVSVLTGLSNSFGITSTTGAGSYAVDVAGTLTNPDYTVSSTVPGSWTVNPASLIYVAARESISPGAAIPPLTGSVTGLVNGQSLATATNGTLSFSTDATSASSAGSYAIDGGGLTVDNSNYASTIAQAPGNATALTITAATTPGTTTAASVTLQTAQFQQVNFTGSTTNSTPLITVAGTAGNNNSGNNNSADVTGSVGTGTNNNGGAVYGSLANRKEGGNGAPPGVRLIDLPVMPLPPGSGVPPPGETRFASNEVVLQFGPGVTPQQIAAMARRFGLAVTGQQSVGMLGRAIYTFRINNGQSVSDIISRVDGAGLNAAAQPNYTYGLTQNLANTNSNLGDPAQYIVAKLHLDAAHHITEGDNVVIALIDSKIDPNQPDLAGTIIDNYDFCSGSAPDAHGTGMAGAIASHAQLLGVAPHAKIIAICAFNGTGTPEATSSRIIKGLDFAIQHGAKIVNMSFTGPPDPALSQALQVAREKGVLVIAAAGNNGPNSPPLYPGADPSVMAVTATDVNDHLFAGANQGSYVAVAAPGVDILVPAPNGSVQLTTGTSVATANVSGVAALLLAEKPTRTPEEIRAILVSTAKHLGAKGVNDQYGAGLVDPVKALRLAPGQKSVNAAPPRRSIGAALAMRAP